jgi:hypothetical protein
MKELEQIDNAIDALKKQIESYEKERAELAKPKHSFKRGDDVAIVAHREDHVWNAEVHWMRRMHDCGLVFATEAERDEKERLLRWLARPKVEVEKGQEYFIILHNNENQLYFETQSWADDSVDFFRQTLRIIDTDKERLEAALPEYMAVFLGEKE